MFRIYWKDGNNQLDYQNTEGYDCHVAAIEATQQMLEESKETFKKPLLAVIKGGKS